MQRPQACHSDAREPSPIHVVIKSDDVWKVVYSITTPQEEDCSNDPQGSFKLRPYPSLPRSRCPLSLLLSFTTLAGRCLTDARAVLDLMSTALLVAHAVYRTDRSGPLSPFDMLCYLQWLSKIPTCLCVSLISCIMLYISKVGLTSFRQTSNSIANVENTLSQYCNEA